MAIPVITSPLTLAAVVNVTVRYRIRATNFPTSYNAPNLPPQMSITFATGALGGKVRAAGTYNVTIQATNGDGTGSATLVITAVDMGIPPPGGTGVTTYPAKQWSDGSERFDYADADDAGHALASFDTDSITAVQLTSDAISNKITAIGGPGRIGQYVFPTAFIPALTARYAQKIVTVSMPGVVANDIVIVDELYNVDTSGNITWPAVNNSVFFGWAGNNNVALFVFNGTGTTIPANSVLNFRVFSFSNG